mmetsp:Transcript_13257/g.32401  ORF Transcript_13257/g.32401 Transcript_13257/m.32401 type:complete len:238 (+) Transcript_13257:1120-1833(+)
MIQRAAPPCGLFSNVARLRLGLSRGVFSFPSLLDCSCARMCVTGRRCPTLCRGCSSSFQRLIPSRVRMPTPFLWPRRSPLWSRRVHHPAADAPSSPKRANRQLQRTRLDRAAARRKEEGGRGGCMPVLLLCWGSPSPRSAFSIFCPTFNPSFTLVGCTLERAKPFITSFSTHDSPFPVIHTGLTRPCALVHLRISLKRAKKRSAPFQTATYRTCSQMERANSTSQTMGRHSVPEIRP